MPVSFVRHGVRTVRPTLASPAPRREKNATKGRFVVEQVMGVGPTSKAWEALILPMNYTCKILSFLFTLIILAHFSIKCKLNLR